MASRTRPTLEKRNKERARQERRKAKDEKRATNKAIKASAGPRRPGDEDPDIAGITPGPQASPWGDDEEEIPESDL